MANASSRRLGTLSAHLFDPHPCQSDCRRPPPAAAAQASADADPDDAPPSIQDMFDMSGRVAIVTGGGTHLGLAMATTLLELGAVVVLASRRVELCEEEAAKLREGGQGYRCYAARCDVTVEEDVEALVKDVVAEHGRLDVMVRHLPTLQHGPRALEGLLSAASQVCNAGGSAATSYIPNASVEEFSATYDMNVKSTYMCAQSAARHAMIAQGSGKIITLGSIHGILSGDLRLYDGLEGFNRSGPPYQAAKGAVVRLSLRPAPRAPGSAATTSPPVALAFTISGQPHAIARGGACGARHPGELPLTGPDTQDGHAPARDGRAHPPDEPVGTNAHAPCIS